MRSPGPGPPRTDPGHSRYTRRSHSFRQTFPLYKTRTSYYFLVQTNSTDSQRNWSGETAAGADLVRSRSMWNDPFRSGIFRASNRHTLSCSVRLCLRNGRLDSLRSIFCLYLVAVCRVCTEGSRLYRNAFVRIRLGIKGKDPRCPRQTFPNTCPSCTLRS